MKLPISILLPALGSILGLAGCQNPINAKTGDRYYEAGFRAEDAGDLMLARRDFSRAYKNAELGFLGPVPKAYSFYNWSRVTGYLGMITDAERGFTNTLVLIDQSKGEADKLLAPTLCELARLYHDTKAHAKAVDVYERAAQELEKRSILTSDPIGFAEFLNDYAESLKGAGFNERANIIQKRSAAIKQQNPTVSAKQMPRRYPAQESGLPTREDETPITLPHLSSGPARLD